MSGGASSGRYRFRHPAATGSGTKLLRFPAVGSWPSPSESPARCRPRLRSSRLPGPRPERSAAFAGCSRSRRSANCGSRCRCRASVTGSASLLRPHWRAELAAGHTYLVQNSSVGLVVFVRLLPAVLLAPLAGAFADRLDRRLTMVIADIGRFSLYVVDSHRAHAVVAVHRDVPDRDAEPVLDSGQGSHGAEPGAARPTRAGQPAEPADDVRIRAGGRSRVRAALTVHRRARSRVAVLHHEPDRPGSVFRRVDVPRVGGHDLHPA